jgi:hypothetical protein
MACMQEMLRVNIRQNLQIVIQIATKYSDALGPVKLIEMFESFKTLEGEHCILRTIVCALTMLNRPLLLRRVYCQLERGSGGSFQVYPGRHSHGKSSALAGRVTSITLRKSRTSSKRRNSRTSFLSSLSAIGSTLFTISFSTFTRMVSPNLSRYMFSESTL